VVGIHLDKGLRAGDAVSVDELNRELAGGDQDHGAYSGFTVVLQWCYIGVT
jgi:hypothetical protein